MKLTQLLENKISILIKKNPEHADDPAYDFDMDDVQEDFQRYMEDTWSFTLDTHPEGFIAHVDLGDRESHELEDDLYNIADKFPIEFERV